MKLLIELIPLILFFAAYKLYDIYTATIVAMISCTLALLLIWIKTRKIDKQQLITTLLVGILGGITLLLHDDIFIKWKPTVVNWLFSIVLLGSQWIGDKPVIQRMMSKAIELPAKVWVRLNCAWGLFFLGMGFLNLYVVYTFDTDTWVNFKLFGNFGLTLVFAIGQAFYLNKYFKTENHG